MSSSTLRSRWAAIGAAVAVCLGAGGVGISQATTSSGDRPVYIPITPCRLADTRPAPDTVGPRTAPLGAGDIYTLNGWNLIGNCNLQPNTSALALNVTAVNPTQLTFLTLWAADKPQPVTSNLNPAPGQPPTPNAVNVALSPTGQFNVFNKHGNVNVIIDVVGIYDHHTHDDRYYTKAQINGLTAANTSTGVFSYDTGALATWQDVIATTITIPTGYTARLRADFGAESTCYGAGNDWCSVRINANATALDPAEGASNAFDSTESGTATFNDYEETSITRTAVLAAGTYTVRVQAYVDTASIRFRLDDLILFVEAHLIAP